MKEQIHDILIIDDEVSNLELLSVYLKEEGYQVRPANNSRLGLMSAINKPPSLIISDVNMPEMSGHQVFEKLQSQHNTQQIPFIFISGNIARADMSDLGNPELVTQLQKPLDYKELMVIVADKLNP